jgi:hypothetical protein
MVGRRSLGLLAAIAVLALAAVALPATHAAAQSDLSVRITNLVVQGQQSITVGVAARSTVPISHIDLRVLTRQGLVE